MAFEIQLFSFYEYIKFLRVVEFTTISRNFTLKIENFPRRPEKYFRKINHESSSDSFNSRIKGKIFLHFFLTPCIALPPIRIRFRRIIYVVQRDKTRHVTQR